MAPRPTPPPTTAITCISIVMCTPVYAVSTWQWVVEVGIPSRLHIITTREADRTEQNPRLEQ